ncbi:MAG: hypothetical protein OHK0029_25120 [Armatimonadaceae bacterium]
MNITDISRPATIFWWLAGYALFYLPVVAFACMLGGIRSHSAFILLPFAFAVVYDKYWLVLMRKTGGKSQSSFDPDSLLQANLSSKALGFRLFRFGRDLIAGISLAGLVSILCGGTMTLGELALAEIAIPAFGICGALLARQCLR